MASSWVSTKVHVPTLRRGVVDRPRLRQRQAAPGETRLTLLSAPAGFGKTTAAAAWVSDAQDRGRAVAWVSLDEADDQPATFWTYVVLALQRTAPTIGANVLPALESGQPPTRALITVLLNELAEQPVDIDLVLDDYHLADSPGVADGVAFLLDHLPPNLHVIITTRADPDLPLSRLRARGQLVEVRARELRFTVDEVTRYLGDVGDLEVAPEDVTTLAERTEGWVAALQLAALSMQGRDDVASFVAGFAGTDRYVVDYLVDEVLSRQPDDVRTFLLRTSVLDRLTGDLCDAVTESSGGRAMLETLYRANLFLVPLDDRRHWYRYHHLFADVLQTHLRDVSPDEQEALHRRASQWYADAGIPAAAVRHALAACDVERAADIAEATFPALQQRRKEATVRGWVDAFPDDVVARRPVLAISFVGGLMQANDFATVDARLAAVERQLPAIHARRAGDDVARDDTGGAQTLVVLDEAELARVPAAVEMYRAALALMDGDPAATVDRARRALAAAVPGDELVRGGANALSGLASWASGDLDEARVFYAASLQHLARAGHLADVLGCTIALADIRITQGQLSDALHDYEDGLRLAEGDDERDVLRGAADMHVGVADVSLERGDVDKARTHLTRALELGESLGLPQFPYRWRASMALIAETGGDADGALDLLGEAERIYVSDFSPDVRPLHARRARVEVAHGDIDAGLRWAADHDVTPDDVLSYAREFEHVTLAEVLLARARRDGDQQALEDARNLLARLVAATEEGGRHGTRVDVLALQSLAADAAGDAASAESALSRALSLAEPEGQVRSFTRHGATMAALLGRAVGAHARSPFVERLRSALASGVPQDPRRPQEGAPVGVLAEPLSVRETEVLRLLASELDGPDIARHLVVSLHTVRTHTKNIYTKLGVNSRRAAVRRAEELGLLSRS
jgi:LuxR family maltose regulon positive regulatory protein